MSVISLWCISVKYIKVVGVTGLNTPQIDNISFVDQRGHEEWAPSLIVLFSWSCRQTLTPLGLRPSFVKSWIRHCICKRNAKHSQCTWIPWWHDFTAFPQTNPWTILQTNPQTNPRSFLKPIIKLFPEPMLKPMSEPFPKPIPEPFPELMEFPC